MVMGAPFACQSFHCVDSFPTSLAAAGLRIIGVQAIKLFASLAPIAMRAKVTNPSLATTMQAIDLEPHGNQAPTDMARHFHDFTR